VNIPIVYADEWLVVVNKPSGLLTIPTPKKESRTLTSILNEELRTKGLSYRLHPCHRLDRETSGLIIYAKGKSFQKKMMAEFKNRRVRKTYLAFVRGLPAPPQGEIRRPIDGLSAKTRYKVIEKRKNFAIVEVEPLTGRTNQVRIHFQKIGHPLLGEAKFAFRRDFKIKAKRVCLHAQALSFRHPITRKIINLTADLPEDMKKILESQV